jgi:hypothetical protein
MRRSVDVRYPGRYSMLLFLCREWVDGVWHMEGATMMFEAYGMILCLCTAMELSRDY